MRAIAAWRGCRDDDAAAWLVREYRGIVASIAARLPHWWLAEDAVEETFTRAFAALDSYDEARPSDAWLARIAINACNDALRNWRRRGRVFVDTDEAPPCVDAAPGADALLLAAEREGAAREMIAGLDPASREAFELHALDGLTAEETAARTGLSPTAVRLRIHRARQHFRERALQRGSALCQAA